MDWFAARFSDEGRKRIRAEAERRGWHCHWVTWDTIGGEHRGIEVTNANGYVLGISGGFNVTDREAEEPDWDAELLSALQRALDDEDRREARRLGTRLRRAWVALSGTVDVGVPNPKRERRPPRERLLERDLREERGFSRRQARDVVRKLQARGQVRPTGGCRDEDIDALLQEGEVSSGHREGGPPELER